MQRCRAWLRRRGITSKNNADDGEPPPNHDLGGTTTGPAADIASITSAISILPLVVPLRTVSIDTRTLVGLLSRMAHAIATTPHARDYHNWGKPEDGRGICATGTAEALMADINSYVSIILRQLASVDGYWSRQSQQSRDDARVSIYTETKSSPLASARIVFDHFFSLSLGFQAILSHVQPVACAPAVAAAITSALANVANAVAAAPEDSMAAVAEMYASYADRTEHRIVDAIIRAQTLRDGTAPVVLIHETDPYGPGSGGPNKSVRSTRNSLQVGRN